MLTTLRASAHDLAGLADKSVHMIATSPPYFGLRAYPGDQTIEWPAVTFRLNEWTEPLTSQGCEPGCAHEWVDGPAVRFRPQQDNSGGLSTGKKRGQRGQQSWTAGTSGQTILGSYCALCNGWRGALGQEPDPVAYIGHLILCLREWRRVLRDDGTCWVNLGDTYAANRGYQVPDSKHVDVGNAAPARVPAGLKAKDLIGIPWLFAIAARADGWYLRSAIVWAKGVSLLPDYAGSVMPESVTDRPSRAHEMVFMLTKSARYYYDNEAVRETSTGQSGAAAHFKRTTKEALAPGQTATMHRDDRKPALDNGTRGLRDVWVINPQPYKAAHYAVWPERLAEQMIRAGSSERGACPQCGAPWLRRTVTEKVPVAKKAGKGKGSRSAVQTGGVETSSMVSGLIGKVTTIGWRPSCICGAPADWQPDDLEIIASPRLPIGTQGRDDPTPTKGRRGLGSTRADGEGRRPMTRYEQRHYAAQLRASPHADACAEEAGDAFAHYRRTGRGGGRPVPPALLESWIDRGWLTRVDVPDWTPPDPVPCVVLDPFAGSGTTARVAIKTGREAVASDLSDEYLTEHVPARTTVQMEMQV